MSKTLATRALQQLRMSNKTVSFKAETNGGVLVIQIYDVIGEDFFGAGITATSVSEAIKAAGDFTSITLRINSPGGDLFEGVAIYNLLRSLGKPVNVVVDGLAGSAASLIAMAGDTITMGDGSMIMIHNAMGLAFGNAKELRSTADLLDTVSASAADIYVARTKMEKAAVIALMDAETWMSAQDAVDKGFATAVSAQAVGVKAKAMAASFDLSVFTNVPEELKAAPVVVGIDVSSKGDTATIIPVAALETPVAEETQPDPLIDVYRRRLELWRKR